MITIENETSTSMQLTANDLVDGHAYEDTEGNFYVCNQIEGIRAFGIKGDVIIFKSDRTSRFREVSLRIIIENL